jgi:hypothetical protein
MQAQIQTAINITARNPPWYHILFALVFSTIAIPRRGAGIRRKKAKNDFIMFVLSLVTIIL